jgi:hypothetical protein
MSYGFNGCVRYLPAGKLPAWDNAFRELASKVGDKPIHLQLTAKTHDHAGLADVLANLPQAWRAGFIYNIYQEPEDNLLDATSQAAYRAAYTDAAKVTRQYGVSLPWVEWMEWTVNPTNKKGWDLKDLTPPASDFGGVLWSMFEYHERDRIDEQVADINAAMNEYAPGKPWALMAGAYTLEGAPYTADQERAQGSWLTRSYRLTKQAGSVGWAWYNHDFPGVGGPAGESRVEENPLAMDALHGVG